MRYIMVINRINAIDLYTYTYREEAKLSLGKIAHRPSDLVPSVDLPRFNLLVSCTSVSCLFAIASRNYTLWWSHARCELLYR